MANNNNKRYKAIIEQYEGAKTIKEKRNCIFTMLCMIANNDLCSIEAKIARLTKWGIIALFVILLAIFFSDQITLDTIVRAIFRI